MFRKRDLGRGLTFERKQTMVGVLYPSTTPSAPPSPPSHDDTQFHGVVFPSEGCPGVTLTHTGVSDSSHQVQVDKGSSDPPSGITGLGGGFHRLGLRGQLKELITAPSTQGAHAALGMARERAGYAAEKVKAKFLESAGQMKEKVEEVKSLLAERVGGFRANLKSEMANVLALKPLDAPTEDLNYQERLVAMYGAEVGYLGGSTSSKASTGRGGTSRRGAGGSGGGGGRSRATTSGSCEDMESGGISGRGGGGVKGTPAGLPQNSTSTTTPLPDSGASPKQLHCIAAPPADTVGHGAQQGGALFRSSTTREVQTPFGISRFPIGQSFVQSSIKSGTASLSSGSSSKTVESRMAYYKAKSNAPILGQDGAEIFIPPPSMW